LLLLAARNPGTIHLLSVDMIFATSTFWTFIQGFSASFVFVYFI
jgi:hypothetical protein